MHTLTDLCFLCMRHYKCAAVDDGVVCRVLYLLPEITIIKLGIPLRICSVCDGALCAFSKFKQSSMESSRRLEARIKGDDSETSDMDMEPLRMEESPTNIEQSEQTNLENDTNTPNTKPENIEEMYLNNETPLDIQMNTNRAFLNPIVLLERLNIVSQKQLHETCFDGETGRRLEARIKGAQGPPLHTASPRVVDDSETSGAKPEKMEEIFIKEEYVEETPLDTNKQIALSETISAEPHNQLHKDRMSQNIQMHTDTNADNIEQIFIKEEQIEETSQDRELYNNILMEKYESNSIIEDTDRQSEHNTEDESSTLNTTEKVWEGSFAESKEETVEKTDGNCTKNMKTGIQEMTNKSKTLDQLEEEYQCNVCSKSFTQKGNLDHHMKIHLGIKDFKCTICKKSFSQKVNFKNHLKSHLGIKDFQCNLCSKSFTQKGNLDHHMKIHLGIKDFKCTICKKSFSQKVNLENHMKSHLGIQDYHCNVCSKSFTQKGNLDHHMKIHLGIKDFQCAICKKSFTQKVNLENHMNSHLGIKEYHCNVCSKSFTQKGNLDHHMKIHSGIKDFKCTFCEKSFSQKVSLENHMKSHLGIKDYHCNVCSKSFTLKKNLDRHMKIHFSIKDFQCAICKKSFTQKENLEIHMKVH